MQGSWSCTVCSFQCYCSPGIPTALHCILSYCIDGCIFVLYCLDRIILVITAVISPTVDSEKPNSWQTPGGGPFLMRLAGQNAAKLSSKAFGGRQSINSSECALQSQIRTHFSILKNIYNSHCRSECGKYITNALSSISLKARFELRWNS